MIQLLEKFKLNGADEFDSSLSVAIYEDFVTITVSLSAEESDDAISLGGVPQEKRALNGMLRKIFFKPFPGLRIFMNEVDFLSWKKENSRIGEAERNEQFWCKTAFIVFEGADFKDSLEKSLVYIKESFAHYNNPNASKQSIAKEVVGRLFR
jgi:hypothetical protein